MKLVFHAVGFSLKVLFIFSYLNRIKHLFCLILGVDDASSECDLDDVKDWDFNVLNNNSQELEESLETLCKKINKQKKT
jgi:phosphomevalonate kinase